jgi:hypothetical protein
MASCSGVSADRGLTHTTCGRHGMSRRDRHTEGDEFFGDERCRALGAWTSQHGAQRASASARPRGQQRAGRVRTRLTWSYPGVVAVNKRGESMSRRICPSVLHEHRSAWYSSLTRTTRPGRPALSAHGWARSTRSCTGHRPLKGNTMHSRFRTHSAGPTAILRRCTTGCGRRATVVSETRDYCTACYTARRSRAVSAEGRRRAAR